jgi:diguanylate cyclase (GGDEF)-like protein
MDLLKKLLSVLFILSSGLALAEPRAIVPDGPVNLIDFRIAYHVDRSGTLSFEDVRDLPFAETGSNASLGTDARVTWYRLVLDNASDADRRLFLHLPHAYHVRSIEFYEERGGALLRNHRLDLDDASSSNLMYRGMAVYPFTLTAGDSTVIYLRSHVFSHQWFAVAVLDEHASRHALVGVNLDIALMVGMLLALVFYNGLLYFATSKKENVFYSLYLISGLVWIALSYGLVANLFGIYGSGVFKLNISLITMPIFLLLFMMSIFDTKQFYPTEHRFLQGLIVLLGGTFVWGLFDISAALKPASSLAALMMIVTFSVSISLYRKGHPLVKYFLVGHTFFVLFNGIAVLFYKGLVSPTYLNSHGVGIGIMLEALTLAFIISHRIKILEDIRSAQHELKKQASTDPLTGLQNRRFFFTEADERLATAKSNQTPLSVLIVDIDHFKRVNDTHGHACGDRVIVTLAQLLKQQSRTDDLVARFGGEEFVLLLPNADLQQAEVIAERIRGAAELASVKTEAGELLRVTVSIGTAALNLASESVEAALARADRALYEAKNKGRNRVVSDLSVTSGRPALA